MMLLPPAKKTKIKQKTNSTFACRIAVAPKQLLLIHLVDTAVKTAALLIIFGHLGQQKRAEMNIGLPLYTSSRLRAMLAFIWNYASVHYNDSKSNIRSPFLLLALPALS